LPAWVPSRHTAYTNHEIDGIITPHLGETCSQFSEVTLESCVNAVNIWTAMYAIMKRIGSEREADRRGRNLVRYHFQILLYIIKLHMVQNLEPLHLREATKSSLQRSENFKQNHTYEAGVFI
jgi:hypothetical protein